MAKASVLLSRAQFKEQVFSRDHNKCVVCGKPAVDAHHIVDRKQFEDGGYYLNNGVSLCATDHRDAEDSKLSCKLLRSLAKIEQILLPPGFDPGQEYDKWGKVIS